MSIKSIQILFLLVVLISISQNSLQAQQSVAHQVAIAEEQIVNQDFRSALEIYKALWEANPDNYDYRLRVGLLKSWMKDFKESEDHLFDMLQDYPNNIEIGTALMRVLSWQHRYAESIKLSREFEATYPNNVDLITITAQSYFWSGAYPDSEMYVERLLELDPNNEIGLSLKKDLLMVQAPWIDAGLTIGWDSEDTELFVIGARGQAALGSRTRFQLGIDRFDTKNDRIIRVADAYSLAGTIIYSANNLWRLRGDLGVASYQQNIANRGDLFLSGGLNLQRNTGKHTTNVTVSHNPILESPILMENRIQVTNALVAYRYRHLNYTFFATPQVSFYSDGNNRKSLLLQMNYSTDGDKFRVRPGIKGQYIAFENIVTNRGYFSPEQLTTALATVEIDRSEPGGDYQFILAGDAGFQKISHPTVNSDPKFLYRLDARFVWSPGDDFRVSTGYEYTNLQTVSSITNTTDYWYQSAYLRLRYQFN